MPIVTLTSDFGLSDSYVGQMKGVLLSLCPSATLVDISHLISPGNIAEAAILIRSAISTYPKDSVHLCVIDPGVGSDRAGLVVETDKGLLVGPDNGLFSYVDAKAVYQIDSEIFPSSSTFDGREVFAPVSGKLASGEPVESLAKKINQIEKLPPIEDAAWIGELVTGRILRIDHFGNAISNISAELMGDSLSEVVLPEIDVTLPLVSNYSDIGEAQAAALVNADGYLEIACYLSSAAKRYGISFGSEIIVR